MIHVLWPTVRPKMMLTRLEQWMFQAHDPTSISIGVAVNTPEQAKIIYNGGIKTVYICGNRYKGVAPPSYVLSSKLEAEDDDIIVLASDDFTVPRGWDTWVKEQFLDYDGSILVNDGLNSGGCVTIPIMTYGCLKSLKCVLYHPEYIHLYSDAELYDNLEMLGKLKNLRKNSPLFEHHHWANGKRKRDVHDNGSTYNLDLAIAKKVYERRNKLTLSKRLKLDNQWIIYASKAKLYTSIKRK